MFRHLVAALAVFAGLAGPAAAFDACADLWFTRNQVFDRAGYCFGSPLGQAVFDNSDCISRDVTPDAAGMALVAATRAREADLGCAIDTSQTRLDIDNLAQRLALEEPVLLDEFASGCLGWTGAPIPLLAGPHKGATQLSSVQRGDDIVWEYYTLTDHPGWQFISVYRASRQIGLGWMSGELDQSFCTNLAG